MEDIESRAIQNYQENMEFFKEKLPPLYNKLLALDTILNDGSYPQKYDLEYKDGYFDVIDFKTNSYLYNQNSEKLSQKLAEQITYKKDEHTFKSYRKTNFDEDTKNLLKDQNAYTQFSTTAQIIDYYYANTDDSMSMHEIDKFIFLGTGLGMHIPKTVDKFNLQVIFIVEDDIELFRLSLFTTNYVKMLGKCVAYFAIAQNTTEFHTSFNNFFTKAFLKNQYIKFNVFSSSYENKIQEIRSLLITRPEATYSHERMLVKNKRVINKIIENYKFIDLKKHSEEKFFADKPWLVLGAGPSLYNNSDWLIENQDKFVIIAAFTALNTLKRIGLKPDIVAQIDENDFTTKEMLEKLEDLDFIKNSIIFFSASVSKLLFDKFDKEKVYLHEDRTKYKLTASTLTVASVGETIYTVALLFNVSNIYVLGIDLALGDDGLSHSPDHFKSTEIKAQEKDDEDKVGDFQLSGNTLDIKGNLRKVVKTTPLFALSIPVINYKTKNHKSDNQKIYNLSDGAYFDNTIPLKPEDIDIDRAMDKRDLADQLKELFNSYSTTKLEGKEIDALKCRESQIADYYKVLNTFKDSPQSNADIFMASYIKFVSGMCNHECTFELNEILTIYFLRIASYVDDFINTYEITNKKKHIKKFKSFFVTQVEKILKTYEEDFLLLKYKTEEQNSSD